MPSLPSSRLNTASAFAVIDFWQSLSFEHRGSGEQSGQETAAFLPDRLSPAPLG
jgi:hypothetical protein